MPLLYDGVEKMKVTWIEIDLNKPKKELPSPLNGQSGGRFWVACNGGTHGYSVGPSWWTGEKFTGWNNEIITHFAIMEIPIFP